MQTRSEPDGGGPPHRNYNPHSGDPTAPTNPGLLNAMRAVALNDSQETRQALYQEFLAATFLLPQPEPPLGQSPALSWYTEGEPFTALADHDLQGRLVIPAFTDTTALFAWAPPDTSYVAMPAAAVFSLMLNVKADVLVINVAGPTGGELTRGEARILAQGGIPAQDGSYAFPEGGTLHMRYPDPAPPDDLVSALWRAAAAQATIEAVYLVSAVFGQGEEHLLAGIEFSPMPGSQDLAEIMGALSESLMAVVDEATYIDFMVLFPGQPIEHEMKSRGMRVYTRLLTG